MCLEGISLFVAWECMHPTAMVGGYLCMDFLGVKWVDKRHLFLPGSGREVGTGEVELSPSLCTADCGCRVIGHARGVDFIN